MFGNFGWKVYFYCAFYRVILFYYTDIYQMVQASFFFTQSVKKFV